MDGINFSAIDQIDQDIFDGSQTSDGEECAEMPIPDCIGIDSALQDEEELRLQNEKQRVSNTNRSRTEEERDLELKVLRPGSIRREILEQSIKRNNTIASSGCNEYLQCSSSSTSVQPKSHVMNITEKAGMSGINKEKINKIIHDASKGSLFYKRQAERQAEIHKSIEKMLNRVKAATLTQVEKAKITCDTFVQDIERRRAFNRVIVHFDLDMFFAAVEIRDNLELKDKPVAVGGDSMISTSNYIARKFGVRAAMPGFIAKKLCPELILIKPNGFKYREASSKVFAVLEQYDPELTGMSLDEAYLDLTEYIKNTLERDNLEYQEYYDGTLPKVWWTRASEVVEEIRQAVFDKTKLTCSAGIACNTLLAKISTDINKPNGQFMVQGYTRDVIDFISKTPIEKVSGIGKVSAQFLNALDIKTCGDIYEKRHILPLVFYEINVKFYLRVSLGCSSTSIKSDEQRKSKSVERTFPAIKDDLILLDKLDNICNELCSRYLKPYRIRGRTITVKLKRNTFMTTTRSYSMLVPTNDKLVIYSAAKNLLMLEIANEPAEISYRLLGVKLSNLADDGVTTNQLTIDAMLRNQMMGQSTKSETSVHRVEDFQSAEFCADNSDEPKITSSPDNLNEPKIAMIEGPREKIDSTQPERKCIKTIDSFFAKRDKHVANSVDVTDKIYHKEPSSRESVTPTDLNEFSQLDQLQNQPNDEDFQCPYCFKPFRDFDYLEIHVESCKMKIPIDVNRSFFSQRVHDQHNTSGSFFSKVKNDGAKTRVSSANARSVRVSSKIKRQPRNDSPPTVGPSSSSPSDPCRIGRKTSFYERFIESNSQNLKRSVAMEPFQCPYCLHGFILFSSLESHVTMCTKKQAPQ